MDKNPRNTMFHQTISAMIQRFTLNRYRPVEREGLRDEVRIWLLCVEAGQDLPDLSVGRISMPLDRVQQLKDILSQHPAQENKDTKK